VLVWLRSGKVSAFIVWGYIYGIGSRVVTDEIYEQLEPDVCWWGAVAGACSDLAINVLPRLWPLGAFVMVHVGSVLAGLVGGEFGWKQGLIGFYGFHMIVVLACGLFGIALLVRAMGCIRKE
jgi:hypothetical protein